MLSKTAEYALRAAVCLGREHGYVASADELAKVTKIPRRYLHKVLQDLIRAELACSQSGPGGGYALAKRPETISILDVVNAVVPLARIDRCPLGLPSHTNLCPLHKELDRVYAAAQKALSRVTIAQLLHSKSSIVPLSERNQLPPSLPLLFACSGCSHAGRLAYDLAQELDRRGIAEMSCLAGVGALKSHFLRQLRNREVWVIDGCPIECALGVLGQAHEHANVHIRLQELGVRKNSRPQPDCNMERLVEAALKQVAAQQAQTHSDRTTS